MSNRWIDDITKEMGALSVSDYNISIEAKPWEVGCPLYEVKRDAGHIHVIAYLHRGQMEAWNATEKTVMIVAGRQSGKTSILPLLCLREIIDRGPGMYYVAGPTLTLLGKKCIPEFIRLFEDILKIGRYNSQKNTLILNNQEFVDWAGGTVEIDFVFATKPTSLESATILGAFLDECGQPEFKLASFEAIEGRALLNQARIFIASTPYRLNWFYRKAINAAPENNTKVVRFTSYDNPIASHAALDALRAGGMQDWRFRMFYLAEFTRPAGIIYGCYDPCTNLVSASKTDEDGNLVPRLIPDSWPRIGGVDFGKKNFACVLMARSPSGVWYLYASYLGDRADETEHIERINLMNVQMSKGGNPELPLFFGGSPGESNWRDQYTTSGLAVLRPPIGDVDTGIQVVYSALARNDLVIFDDREDVLEEIATYSNETDEDGNVKDTIENKGKYHLLDCVRYAETGIQHLYGEPDAEQQGAVDWMG